MPKTHAEKCHLEGHRKFTVCNCDGYHTFDELYEHRYTLFIALCKSLTEHRKLAMDVEKVMIRYATAWRSKLQSDGQMYDGYFIIGIGKDEGYQMTYHLPIKYWDECDFAETLDKAPEYDGHSSDDVLERLRNL